MDEQFQRTLAGFGHSLGIAAQQNNEMGLLYALRNAKKAEGFPRTHQKVEAPATDRMPATPKLPATLAEGQGGRQAVFRSPYKGSVPMVSGE
jgi:hypothetical protein